MGVEVMSINSRMKLYNLYVNNPIEDSYGHQTDNFILEGEVMVALQFNSLSKRSDDIRYKDCEYSGLTVYKGLDLSKKYKLVPKGEDGLEYLIKSVNELARLSQYLLQAVV